MKKIRADNWANLPFDILLLIAKRIRFLDDYANFGLVCKSWLDILYCKDIYNSLRSSLYPMLMLKGDRAGQREFYNPFNGGGIFKSKLPEIRGNKCWGSSNGWLITLDNKHRIHLFNPLSRRQVQLPMLVPDSNIPMDFDFYKKIIVSADNSSWGDFVVFAIYSGCDLANRMVASTRPGAESWIPLQCPYEDTRGCLYDAVYFDGKFYIVGRFNVSICNSNGLFLRYISLPWISDLPGSNLHVTYIVNFGGQIYLIARSSGSRKINPTKRTTGFKVFKLDEETQVYDKSCEDVFTLDNWSIFVGSNNTFAVSCIDYPECKSNCIYFTDHFPTKKIGSSYDSGVYNLADGTIKPLFRENNLSLKHNKVPVWVKPIW